MESKCIDLINDSDWNAYLRAYLSNESFYRRYMSKCIGWVWKDRIKIGEPRFVRCPKMCIQFGAYMCGAIIGDKFGAFLIDEYGSIYYPKHQNLRDSFEKGLHKEDINGHSVFNAFFDCWRENGRKSKRSRRHAK